MFYNRFQTILQAYHDGQLTIHLFLLLCHTSTPHNNLSNQLTAFPDTLLAHWWKKKHFLSDSYLSNVRKNNWRIWVRSGYQLSYRGAQRHTLTISKARLLCKFNIKTNLLCITVQVQGIVRSRTYRRKLILESSNQVRLCRIHKLFLINSFFFIIC